LTLTSVVFTMLVRHKLCTALDQGRSCLDGLERQLRGTFDDRTRV